MTSTDRFSVIGENLHATRVMRRTDPRVAVDEHGAESVSFVDDNGRSGLLPISDAERDSATYKEGRVKHVRLAIQTAIRNAEPAASTARAYLKSVVDGQLAAGADYLDLNVDEVSLDLDEQMESMRWLVRMVGSWTTTPVAIDSPNPAIIAAGVEQALQGSSTPPMVNSASLERLDPLDLAVSAGAPVIVSAAGESGMPKDDDGRVENAGRMVELALARGIPLERIYIDPLVFPISVDSNSGGHCLAAIRRLRDRYGPDIHVTGGFSNVSFGLPNRQLVNEAFLTLAIDAGADSGIIDPVATSVSHALALDESSRAYQLAVDTLTGRDRGCRRYLSAYRAGELSAMG